MKIKLLFVISNLNIGGPQKSLLALLDIIDYNIFEVDVLVIRPHGVLKDHFNKNVKIINCDGLVTAATLPSYDTLNYIYNLLQRKKIKMIFSFIVAILKNRLFKKNMNQERQSFWVKYKECLPKFKKQYDMAFGIGGQSTYVMVDLVNSKFKYHWIRSDQRILNRNNKIDSIYFKNVDGCLSVSKECAIIFSDMFPFMKNKIKVFYNYIPEKFYSQLDYNHQLISKDHTISLISVCRLDPLKGIDLAIDACEILAKKNYDLKWYILGDGNQKEIIEQKIKKKQLNKYFKLLGFQLNTFSLIKEADIFVHPSRTEGKSNVVDEAKYLAKPIVITNYDTVGEVIENEKTGLICEMNGNSIASAIERLILDRKMREKLSNNCISEKNETVNPTEFLVNLNNMGV